MIELRDKNVIIFGFGRCGVSLVKYLHQKGAKITVHDRKTRGELGHSVNQVSAIEFNLNLGRLNVELLSTADLVILSNSIEWNLPELEQVRAKGIKMIYELEFAYLCTEQRPKTVVVSGHLGKSSTAFGLYELLLKGGKSVFLQGELGHPLTEAILSPTPFDAWIVDASTKLINRCPSVKAEALIVTNAANSIMIDDLRKVLGVLMPNGVLVINRGDEGCKLLGQDYTGRLLQYIHADITSMASIDYPNFEGSFMMKKKLLALRFKGENYQVVLDKFKLEGSVARENLCAILCGAACYGISLSTIKEFVNEFKGAPHRMEFVRRKDSVRFFNDSVALDVSRVINAVKAFDRQVILIMGGKDQDRDYHQMVETVKKKVKCLVLVGESKERINRVIGDYTETYLVGTFEEAVFLSYQKTRSGDVVLLAPGSDATDLFKRYEERGEYYRKLVHQI